MTIAGRLPSALRNGAVLYLSSLAPFLNFLEHNQSRVTAADVARTLAYAHATFLVGLVLTLLLGRLIPRPQRHRLTIAVSTLILAFFAFPLVSLVPDRIVAWLGAQRGGDPASVVLMLLLGAAAFRAARSPIALPVAQIVAVALVLVPVAKLSFLATSAPSGASGVTESSPVARRSFARRPNVYYFVPDGYARADTLQRVFGHDNEGFLDGLRRRGFFVARNSHANYPQTFLSLSSTLSMTYLATPASPPFKSRREFMRIIAGHNVVVRQFRANGYRYVHAGSRYWTPSNCSGVEDVCLTPPLIAPPAELEAALLEMTPLSSLNGYAYLLSRPTMLVDVEAGLHRAWPRAPFFLFAHTLPPHPPFVIDRDCVRRDAATAAIPEDDPASKPLYVDAVVCVNKMALSLFDRILSRDPTAIIAIQSDHGSASSVDWTRPIDAWAPETVAERLSNFFAIKLPDGCRATDDISPVNTFRLIFACLEGRAPQYLENRSYVAAYESNRSFGQVYPVRP